MLAEEITICSRERMPKEVLREAPQVDGLKVQAIIFTFPKKGLPEQRYFKKTWQESAAFKRRRNAIPIWGLLRGKTPLT